MNEWNFVDYGTLAALGMSATINKFKLCGDWPLLAEAMCENYLAIIIFGTTLNKWAIKSLDSV